MACAGVRFEQSRREQRRFLCFGSARARLAALLFEQYEGLLNYATLYRSTASFKSIVHLYTKVVVYCCELTKTNDRKEEMGVAVPITPTLCMILDLK